MYSHPMGNRSYPNFPTGRWVNTTEAIPLAQVSNGDGSNGNKIMLAVEIPLMVLAISTVAVRLYSRLAVKRKLATDDVLIVLGLICGFSRTVISCMSADDTWGFDIDGPDHESEIPYYQHIFERRICYIFASVFTRCSVLAYYLRIFPPGLASLRRLSWALLALTIAQWAEVFTVLIFYCQDIGKLWTRDYLTFSGSRCFSSSTYSYSASIGDCVLDCMIFALPIPYVWSLSKLKARQRIGLIIIFALGFIVCVVALLQIPFIKRRADNASYFGGAINLLIAIQLSLAIIAASLPDIRALVARSFPNFSPLHHRSLNTQANNHGPRQEFRHAEEGQPVTENSDHARAAFEGRRNFRKPDWMRDTLPQSLMSTTITQTEMRRGSEYTIGGRRGSSWTIPTVPTLPEQSLIEELPTPSSSNTGRVLAEAERDTKKIPKVI